MGKDDICRCPEEHRLVLDGTCWRCLGRAAEPVLARDRVAGTLR